MARPPKDGVEYFSLDCDFFEDKKIKLIRGAYGAKGLVILLAILCAAYKENGYFKRWDDDDCVLMADAVSCGCTPELVAQVVQECLKRAFFHEGVFQGFRVLTSPGIQRRYVRACAGREEIPLVAEYCLIDVDDIKDVPARLRAKLTLLSQSSTGNPVKSTGNPDKSAGNPKRKGKEIIEEEEESAPDPAFAIVKERCMEQLGQLPKGAALYDLAGYTVSLGPDVVCFALEHTGRADPDRPVPYLLRVLGSWAEAGVRTVCDAKAYVSGHGQRKERPGRQERATRGAYRAQTGNPYLDMLGGDRDGTESRGADAGDPG